MRYIALWILGSFISNILMDVMVMIRFTNSKCTLWGVLNMAFHIQKVRLPNTNKWFNTYFSMLFTWAMAFAALFVIVVLVATKNANNGTFKQKAG